MSRRFVLALLFASAARRAGAKCNRPGGVLGAGIIILAACAALPAWADPVVGPRPQAVDDAILEGAPGFKVETWIAGLEAPWSLVFLPDGRALVSERPGRIRLIRGGILVPEPYATLDVATGGEGGLMGLAVHPDFPRVPLVYAMLTYFPGPLPAFHRQNRVVRLRDQGGIGAFDRVVLDGIPGSFNHNGGRIGFGPDGMLYVATGDTYQADLAQDPNSLAGKILRLTPEGAIPADNPFPGSPIYSFGHRNPQGLAWHPATKNLFISEHGPSGEFGLGGHDEINVVVPGGNYGWPKAVGAPGRAPFSDPLIAWKTPTTPPSGAAFWQNDLFVATLRSEALIRVVMTHGRAGNDYRVERIERLFGRGETRPGRLRDAVAGPDGALYVLTNNR
ncbi:MAG: PQQ-dependent sugar dehydrogenase, partial [Rhodospirillales bacterium]|nr:PQQ-dependent sugar dehydrogenase [Rhodospirillales bacterium]